MAGVFQLGVAKAAVMDLIRRSLLVHGLSIGRLVLLVCLGGFVGHHLARRRPCSHRWLLWTFSSIYD